MNYQKIIDEVYHQVVNTKLSGVVASYIPELADVSSNKFGIHLSTIDGKHFAAGDSEERLSIQSVTKVLLLTRAILEVGSKLLERVGVEPSGNKFNSLVQLEYEEGIPRNPLINAGALVVCDVLVGLFEDPKSEYLSFVRKISGSSSIDYDKRVAASEQAYGYHNKAIVNLMKDYGNIHNEVEEVLDLYFHACSLAMSCRELAHTFTLYSNAGSLLNTGEEIISPRQVKRINSVMQTCGLYDEAGEFAFRVGLPAKSGVGGGIVAVNPGEFSVAVWGPGLNPKGNSVTGFLALENLTNLTGSIF